MPMHEFNTWLHKIEYILSCIATVNSHYTSTLVHFLFISKELSRSLKVLQTYDLLPLLQHPPERTLGDQSAASSLKKADCQLKMITTSRVKFPTRTTPKTTPSPRLLSGPRPFRSRGISWMSADPGQGMPTAGWGPAGAPARTLRCPGVGARPVRSCRPCCQKVPAPATSVRLSTTI